MRKLRILQYGPTAYRGGVAVAIADLCRGLAQDGHEVGLVCNGGEVLNRLDGSGVEVFLQNWVSGANALPSQAMGLARVLRSFRPDIIHTHGRSGSMASTLTGRYPDVFTLHSSTFTQSVGIVDKGPLRRLLSPMGRKVIVLNDATRAYCRQELGLADDRIFTVLNGVDVARFAPADPARRERLRADLGIGPGQTLVLYVGRFHPEKQPEAVVKLADALRSRGNDDVRFVMIGDGELRDPMAAMVSQLGLTDRISILDFRDPVAAYQAADLLVMPSLHEGFGLVAIEAIASGCPVLRTRTGGFHETIVDGVTGYGCDVAVEDFVAKAISVLDDPAGRARVAENGRRKVLADLTLEAHVRATVDVYRAAVA